MKLYKLALYILISLLSCQKQEEEGTYPCVDGNCNVTFEIPGDSIYANGYHHVKLKGHNYFQVKGKLDELNSEYTYTPSQNFFIDDEMIGDSATFFMRAVFNNDFGRQDIKYYSMNVVFE